MGFIPLFILLGGVAFLFFFTVKSSLNSKVSRQKELLKQLASLNPALGINLEESNSPDDLLQQLKTAQNDADLKQKSILIIRELKVNKLQYNKLIKEAPYNWVAKILGFHAI